MMTFLEGRELYGILEKLASFVFAANFARPVCENKAINGLVRPE